MVRVRDGIYGILYLCVREREGENTREGNNFTDEDF